MQLKRFYAAVLGLRDFAAHPVIHRSRPIRAGSGWEFTAPDTRLLYFPVLAVTLLLCAFSFIYGLGSYPLLDNNEGLYAEIAREMLDSGNYIIPHLLGVPYLEKPPLLYWLMAISFSLFGPSAASARLISAGSMLLLAIFLLIFCKRFGNLRTGIYAALIFSTVIPGILVSRSVLFDPLLTALMGGCLLCYFQWYIARKKSRLHIGAVLLALATLEKGGVAIMLTVGIIICFAFMMRDRAALQALADRNAVALFLLIAVPWHIAAAMQQPGFIWFYFINEHILRFLGLRKPVDYHIEPVYFYLVRLPVILLPWTPFLFLFCRAEKPANDLNGMAIRFFRAWILFPLLFFSVSRAKGGYYLLMILPAVALLLSLEITRRSHFLIDRTLSCCIGITSFFTTIAVAILLVHEGNIRPLSLQMDAEIAGVLICATIWTVYSNMQLIFKKQNELRDAAIFVIALITTPVLVMLLHTAQSRSTVDSSQAIAALIEGQAVHNEKVFIYKNYEDVFSSLPFYLDRKAQVIDSVSADLQFGCHVTKGRDSACLALRDFQKYASRLPVAVAVEDKRLEQFYKATTSIKWRDEAVGTKHVLFNF